MKLTPCPCGRTTGKGQALSLDTCCGPYHANQNAPDAESLMRSRYSAFALAEIDHLLRTQPSEEPLQARRRSLEASCQKLRWRGLEIVATEAGGPDDLEGTVTFIARYSAGDGAGIDGCAGTNWHRTARGRRREYRPSVATVRRG